jgi:hypothetical protein
LEIWNLLAHHLLFSQGRAQRKKFGNKIENWKLMKNSIWLDAGRAAVCMYIYSTRL